MAKLKAPEPPVNEGTLSTCALVMTGKEKLPKGAVLAEKADFNLLYVNFEHTPRMIRIESKAANRVHVQVYNELSREWIKTTVPMNYPLHTQVDALPTTHRPNVGQQVRVKETSSGAGPRTIKSNGNNSVTGCRSGSIGDLIGQVMLAGGNDTQKKAEAVFKASCKEKSPTAEYITKRTMSWIGFLRKEHPTLYTNVKEGAKDANKK